MNSFVNDRIKVVVLGGGNGASFMLRALKPLADRLDITGIIAMSDSGGSSGFLRKKYGVLPPGDLLRALIALSSYDSDALKEMLYTKRFPALTAFADEPKNAANLGNLLLTFLQRDGGGIVPALAAMHEALQTVGRVVPITITHTHLCAELSDGTFTTRECDLDKPNFERHLTVKRVWIEPECEAYGPALQALREADIIFFGPGDLYTSVIATVTPGGVWGALSDSKAKFIQVVARSRSLRGEPSPATLSGIVKDLEQYLPRPADTILYNSAAVTDAVAAIYVEKGWQPIVHDIENLSGRNLADADFESERGGFDYAKMSAVLKNVLRF